MENTRGRKFIEIASLESSAIEIVDKTYARLHQKGWGTFSSSHEILGIITEEYHELIDAVKSNNLDKVHEELLDIAVACNIAIACYLQKTLEW